MAAAKTNQNLKREKKAEKRRRIDRITNRFMINMSWGILCIIILLYMQNILLVNPGVLKIPAIIFGVAAVALFVCAKLNVFKNTWRAYHYSIFALVAAVVSLIMAFYPKIRLVVGTGLDSRWWVTWGPIGGILIYLVVMFVVTAVLVARIEKRK